MTRSPELSVALRATIVAKSEVGLSGRKIAQELNLPQKNSEQHFEETPRNRVF